MNSGTPDQAREVGALMYVDNPSMTLDMLRVCGQRRRGQELPVRESLHQQPLIDRAL